VALLLLIGVKLVGAWWRSDHPRPADSTEGGLGAWTERLLGGRERAPSAVKSAPDPVAGELAAALTPYGIAARRIEREHMTEVVTGRQKAERWRVPLPGGLSLVKVNLAITEVAPRVGLEVLDAWEEPTQHGNGLTMTLGRKGQLHYRLEFAPTDSLAPGAVAVLIGGFGPDWDQTGEDFLEFPAPISIAVLPGYQGSEKIADAARKAGVEVLLHLPMEPDRYPQVNPGPEAILVHLKPAEVRARMRRGLNELGPVRGIAAYMGSRATTDPELVEIVLDETRRQGLFFLDNGVAARSVVPAVARRVGTPCVTSEVVLDGNRDGKAIARQMAAAIKLAESSRDVVVIGHGYPETYAVLRAVLPELRARGIEVVPVSRLAGAELPLDAAASHGR
jgi:polysaccharide deacetylase 2 family uncharacterized protein YibQ